MRNSPINPEAFRRAMGRYPGKLPYGTFLPDTSTPKPLPQAVLYHYWHPDRDGVEPCPKDFAARLTDIHRDLRMVRPPGQAPTASRPWLMWMKQPRITHPISPGWQLLFCWQDRSEVEGRVTLTPLPLDTRVFANLYKISAQAFGGAMGYFDAVVSEIKASKAKVATADKSYRDDRKHDYWQSTKIKNIGAGSKFARHHDGTIVPSRGESNWLRERGTRDMPSEVARDYRERPRLSKREVERQLVTRRRR